MPRADQSIEGPWLPVTGSGFPTSRSPLALLEPRGRSLPIPCPYRTRALRSSPLALLATRSLTGVGIGTPRVMVLDTIFMLAWLLVMLRVGFLSTVVMIYVNEVFNVVPLTLDPSAWYFGRSALVLAIWIGLAAYGCVVSMGRRRWLPEGLVRA